MTKEGFSLIAVVMDRSGSMNMMREATIAGFNALLEDQKKQPGTAKLYYTQFDDIYEVVHDFTDLQDMAPLTEETYKPRGNTALLDAIGKTIVTVGERLAAMPEDERPANVIVVIQTDGLENASQEYREPGRIKEMIREQRERWNWQFIWLTAGEDAMNAVVHGLGAITGQTVNYNQSGGSNRAAYASVSSNVSHVRMVGKTREFTEEEREAASKVSE